MFVTGLSDQTDKTSVLSSKLRGQDALILDVPTGGTVLSDNQM
jgi:hypothetical protein